MRKRRVDADAAAAKEADKPTARPFIEKSDVKITPYPRTGNNKKFEDILDRNLGEEKEPASKQQAAKPKPPDGPALTPEILEVADVAEWVAWPFMFWAQINSMPTLRLLPQEATSLAEPLTSILNRHGATRVLPPDAIDGLKVSARLTPIMADRFRGIQTERAKRAKAGGVTPSRPAPGPVRMEYPQGGQPTKPKEV